MGNTTIEWTATYNADGTITPGKTWSPLRVRVRSDAALIASNKGYLSLIPIAAKMAGHVGPHCEAVSAGCTNCYAGSNNSRCLPANGAGLPFDRRSRDLVESFVDYKILKQPLSWKNPCKVFVANQTDLFGEWFRWEQIDMVFAIMADCPRITFQILTKRPERMLQYLDCTQRSSIPGGSCFSNKLPLPNVWLGVSAEDQTTANQRVPVLLQTPAAVRFVSYEPALGPVDLTRIDHRDHLRKEFVKFAAWSAGRNGGDVDSVVSEAASSIPDGPVDSESPWLNALTGEWFDGVDSGNGESRLSWVIDGAESGTGARPSNIAWHRSMRDQCEASGTAYFFKQWGAYVPAKYVDQGEHHSTWSIDGNACGVSGITNFSQPHRWGDGVGSVRVRGKKIAGDLLDGKQHHEFPVVSA